jgi:glycerol-3-phosphate dehydrogenase (NAD(P)+)
MSNIVVLGAGGFGVALSVMANEDKHNVTLWSAFENELENIKRDGEHKKLLPNVKVSKDIKLTTDITTTKDADLVIMAVPSGAVREVAKRLKGIIGEKSIICNVAKGVEEHTLLRLSEVISEELPELQVVALSGPSHAEEIANKMPTTVVVSSKTMQSALEVQEILMNDYLRIYTNSDIIGVELGGALKNIIAICTGACDGLKLGDNTKAAIMTRGLAEISRLGVAMGAKVETFAGLTGIGDLIVTCTSMHSRNRRAGILMGQGVNPTEAIKQIGMTVEGVSATKVAHELSQKYNVKMPIVENLYNFIYGDYKISDILSNLMSRPKRSESESSWL